MTSMDYCDSIQQDERTIAIVYMKKGMSFMRKFCAVLTALCLLLLLSGCGDVPQTNGQLRLYLRPWGYSLENLIARFQEEHPGVEVILDDHSRDDDIDGSRSAVAAALMSGQGPDIIFEPEFLFGDVQKVVRSGMLLELSPLLDADPAFRRDDYLPQIVETGQWGDGQYLIPLAYNMTCLLTTRSILEKAGIDPERCKTWLSLTEELEAYRKRGGERKAFDAQGFAVGWPSYLGYDYLDYDARTASFSYPLFARGAELYKGMRQEDREMLRSYSPMEGWERLLDGKVLFAAYPFASAEYLFLCAGAAKAAGEEPLLIPIADENGRTTGEIVTSVGINANSPNRQNAYDFLMLMLSPESLNSENFSNDLPVRSSDLEQRFDRIRERLAAGAIVGGRSGDRVFPVTGLPEQFYADYRSALSRLGKLSNGVALPYYVDEYLTPYYEDRGSFESCRRALEEGTVILMSE